MVNRAIVNTCGQDLLQRIEDLLTDQLSLARRD
jgi:hypothetical protein